MIYKNEKFIFLYNKSKEYHQEDVFIAIKGTTKININSVELLFDISKIKE